MLQKSGTLEALADAAAQNHCAVVCQQSGVMGLAQNLYDVGADSQCTSGGILRAGRFAAEEQSLLSQSQRNGLSGTGIDALTV